jgi:hypothetical protein
LHCAQVAACSVTFPTPATCLQLLQASTQPFIGPVLLAMVSESVGASVVPSNFTDNELREEIEAMEVALRWLIENPFAGDERISLVQKQEAAQAELKKRNARRS